MFRTGYILSAVFFHGRTKEYFEFKIFAAKCIYTRSARTFMVMCFVKIDVHNAVHVEFNCHLFCRHLEIDVHSTVYVEFNCHLFCRHLKIDEHNIVYVEFNCHLFCRHFIGLVTVSLVLIAAMILGHF